VVVKKEAGWLSVATGFPSSFLKHFGKEQITLWLDGHLQVCGVVRNADRFFVEIEDERFDGLLRIWYVPLCKVVAVVQDG